MLRRLIVVFLSLSAACPAFAGAWLQPQGKGLAIGQATYYSTDEYFDSNGERQSQLRYRKYEFQPYVEYGLSKHVTIGGSAYVDYVRQGGDGNFGIADPEIFARTRVWHDEKQTVSLQPLIKFSSYYANGDAPRSGSRSVDAELSVLYGRGQHLLTSRDYVDARIGYRMRSRGLSDQIRADLAVGFKVDERFEIIPALRGVLATDIQDAAVYSENGELDYSMAKAELMGLYHLNDEQALQATIFKHIAGVQAGAGYGASVGFAQVF